MSIPEISVDELAVRIASGGAVVFDVRNPDEYDAGHVRPASLVPLPEVPSRVEEFPTDVEVLVVCRSGARSAQAVEFLRTQGVNAINVTGGTMAWIQAGHPVETGAA